MDRIFRFLNRTLPLRWQHAFRDSGGFRALHDYGAIALACGLILVKPSLLLLHCRIGASKRVHYHLGHNQIEVYDTLASSEEGGSIAEKGGSNRMLVFVHGGAWGSGQLWMYRVIANNISRCVCCDQFALVRYPVYPEGSILDQAKAVGSAVNKARNCLGDAEAPKEVVLAGHSSGANIAALSLVKQFCEVSSFISLAGVFDIYKHFLWESKRGVMEVSPMKAAAGGVENMAHSSPSLLTLPHLGKTHFLLYHGISDDTVPCEQTEGFALSLESGGARVHVVYRPVGHAAPIVDFLFYDRNTHSKSALRELYDHSCCANRVEV